MTKAYVMNGLVEKMQSPDQDFRYMGLNDLMTEIKQDSSSFLGDDAIEKKVLKQVMALVQDKISEVKNQAVKCLGQLIKIISESQMDFVVDQLITFLGGKDDELRDIAGLALKTITAELPVDGKVAIKACDKLAPKLLGQLSKPETSPETLIETLMTLSILVQRFPNILSTATLDPSPLAVTAPLLSHPRPAVRRRTTATLAQFVPISHPALFSELLNKEVIPSIVSASNSEKQQTMVQLVAAVARHSPGPLVSALSHIVPGILKLLERDSDDARESSLQTLEVLVLRCPVEITPFLSQIIQAGNQFIKHDPNYAGDDEDEDEEMGDADDDDDAELDEYEDEEDTSYKIRRAATKLLSAVVSTRPELLITIYKDVSPILISRFGDRESTVKLEVWSTYAAILRQTKVFGASTSSNVAEATGGKRKRDSEEMEVEGSPATLLQTQVPALAKALTNQMKQSKANATTLQAGFDLLASLLRVLPGSLSSHSNVILPIVKYSLTPALSTSNASLHVACLAFLRLYFSTHSPPTFSSSLPSLIPVILKSLRERHPRIASEAFLAVSALIRTVRPVKAQDWPDQVYDEAISRLRKNDTDAEVRSCAEETFGDLWIFTPDVVKQRDRKDWDAVCRTTGRTEGAVIVVDRVAREGDVGVDWVNDAVQWLFVLLKKGGRPGKSEAFTCLEALIKRYQGAVPSELPSIVISQLKSFISVTDVSLLAQALIVLSLLLQQTPATTFPDVERGLLKDIYELAHSPRLTGAALDALLAFIAALVEADNQIATHLIPNLMLAAEKAPKAETNFYTVARCVAQVVKSHQGVAAGTIAEFSKHMKSPEAKAPQVVLSLLVLGELGRFIDMSSQSDVFAQAANLFTSEDEGIRSAAAFAAGNIAIGNTQQFLPPIVQLVQNDPTKRLLALHALKELVQHSSQAQLEKVADALWVPLFENSETSEETTRNVAAACLGKLTTTHPSRYLPQLHARVHDESSAARATVVTAIRYTFADTASAYDEVLAPLIVDFLSPMGDNDLTVRRLAISALNSAARTKPHLIREHLGSILPILYKETVVKPELIRTVQMGPWTQKFDDGLEARKTAFETMYTLLDTCLSKLDMHEFINVVIAGLSDDSDEVKVISHMMLFRLAAVAPTAVSQRLDEATPVLEKTIKGAAVTKDTVKQDLERTAELQRSTLRAVAALAKIGTDSGSSPKFERLVEELRRDAAWGNEFKELLS